MYLALDALFMIELKGKTIEWTQLSIPVLPENRIQEIRRAKRRRYRCITAPNCTRYIHIKAQLLQPEHRDCFNSIMIV